MKAPERAAARTPTAGRPPGARAKTAEIDGQVTAMGDEFVEDLEETTDRALAPDLFDGEEEPTMERAVADPRTRARRATLVSPIPALMAETMRLVGDATQARARDPAAPAAQNHEITRRVQPAPGAPAAADGSGPSSYSVELIDEAAAASSSHPRQRAAALIERARTCLARGDLGGAVLAADEVMADGELTKAPGVSDLLEQARPLLDRIFVAYIGLLSEVPVMARSDDDIAGEPLDDKTRSLLARVDGVLTLEQLFSTCKIPAVDAVRIAASLLSTGIIRVV